MSTSENPKKITDLPTLPSTLPEGVPELLQTIHKALMNGKLDNTDYMERYQKDPSAQTLLKISLDFLNTKDTLNETQAITRDRIADYLAKNKPSQSPDDQSKPTDTPRNNESQPSTEWRFRGEIITKGDAVPPLLAGFLAEYLKSNEQVKQAIGDDKDAAIALFMNAEVAAVLPKRDGEDQKIIINTPNLGNFTVATPVLDDMLRQQEGFLREGKKNDEKKLKEEIKEHVERKKSFGKAPYNLEGKNQYEYLNKKIRDAERTIHEYEREQIALKKLAESLDEDFEPNPEKKSAIDELRNALAEYTKIVAEIPIDQIYTGDISTKKPEEPKEGGDKIENEKEPTKNNAETDTDILDDDARNIIEQVKNMPFKERIEALKALEVISNTYRTGNRPVVVTNIAGEELPFYRSSSGTGGKNPGKWYPMFGFGKHDSNDDEPQWLIKGTIEDLENGFDSEAVKKYSKIINETLDWDHDLDVSMSAKNHPFFESSIQGDLTDFNKTVFGAEDLQAARTDKSSYDHIRKVLERINAAYENNKDHAEDEERDTASNSETEKTSDTSKDKLFNEAQKANEAIKKTRDDLESAKAEEQRRTKESSENAEKPSYESFTIQDIKKQIQELLQSVDAIKEIKKFEITASGDKFILDAKIKAGKSIMTSDVTIDAVELVNDGNTVKLEDGFLNKISATSFEDTVKSNLKEQSNAIGSGLIAFAEKQLNKDVERVWIEGGELRVQTK